MSVGVMMMLDPVLFSVNSTSYNELERVSGFTWKSQPVIGRQPVYQFLGHGEKTITLRGRIYPGQYGSRSKLLLLEQSAGFGIPLPLFGGGGLTFGVWCITEYSENDTRLVDNGDPRQIDFTVKLVQYAGLADFLTGLASNYIKTGLGEMISGSLAGKTKAVAAAGAAATGAPVAL